MISRRILLLLLLSTQTIVATTAAEREAEISIVPVPASVELLRGSFTLDPQTAVLVQGGAEAEAVAHQFGDWLFRLHRFNPEVVPAGSASNSKNVIQFTLAQGAASGDSESYRLEVSSRQIVVDSGSRRGLFYGATTLLQLLTGRAGPGEEIEVPALRIVDAPRLRWRGLLLDSARRYQSVEFIKRFIDAMAFHKLNVLHWQLADDEAWRLEIRKYPKLMAPGQGTTAGFYTHTQIREIVQHAEARNVTIVPGFEMPGHARAVVAAYPQFGAAADSAATDTPVFFNVDDATFQFLGEVFAEVSALFPGEYVHIGASEIPKDQWASSPRVQPRMQALGLANAQQLHQHFIERIGELLVQNGRRLAGWDSALWGAPPGALVTTAKGLDGALVAAGIGREVVVSAELLNFDHRQASAGDEPLASGDLVSLADVYAFDPAPTALSAQDRSRLIGMQANVWTAGIPTDEDVERMTFPRAAAAAEVAWSPPHQLNWPDFQKRLVSLTARYERFGIHYSDAAFRVLATQREVSGDRITLELAKQVPLGVIHYTLDGSEPTAASPIYMRAMEVSAPATLKAAAFYNDQQLARTVTLQLDENTIARQVD